MCGVPMSRLEVREITDASGLGGYECLNRAAPQGSVFTSSIWAAYLGHQHRVIGVYKGLELVGGAVVYEAGGGLLPIVPGTPWSGPISRSDDEGENIAVATCLAQYLLRRYTDVTLTLPPEWVDVRGFTWAGMRSQVRYTYRGEDDSRYEKRLTFKPAIISGNVIRDRNDEGDWWIVTAETGDTQVTTICDWRTVYYWKANLGGSWHSECVDGLIKYAMRQGRQFDLVGANSPKRGLFKRQFGGRLTPYYMVTTLDPRQIAELWPPKEAQVA